MMHSMMLKVFGFQIEKKENSSMKFGYNETGLNINEKDNGVDEKGKNYSTDCIGQQNQMNYLKTNGNQIS